MRVNSLKLINFRNYKEEKIDFYKGINIFYGENAQGKTNIIEALYIFSSSKSHRGVKDRDLISFNENEGEIEIDFFSQNRDQVSQFKLYKNKNKKLFINSIEQKQLKALFGLFSTVIFSPEDLNLIKNGPEERRKFLDIDISQLRPNYYKIIKEYKKTLELKNNLLKKDNIDIDLFNIYNERLSKLSSKITVHRHQFTMRLNELSKAAHFYISGNKENLTIDYKSNLNTDYELNQKDIYEKYKDEYEKIKDLEINKKAILFGPHRDDLIFNLNGHDAKTYASQGQQRSIILSLKLAEYEFMKEVLSEPPVLLLDDILSELDLKRQNKLLNFIKDNQTIITCTDKDIYLKIKHPYKIFLVNAGNIIKK